MIKNYSYNIIICGKSIGTFFVNYCWLLQCFFFTWFFYIKLSLLILFFLILSWLRITITSKAKSCGGNTVVFLTKHYGLTQFFLTWFFSVSFVFFYNIFSKIIFVNFFLILSWLEFNFVIKLNHVGKHCSFPHETLWIATVSFHMVFFSLWFF